MEFRFVGNSATRTKNEWPIRAKARALSLMNKDTTASKVIAGVADEFGIDISETPSYIKNAGSHIGRFRTEMAKRLAKGDQEAINACTEYGIPIQASE